MEKKMYDGGTGLGISIEIPKGEEEYYELLSKLGDTRDDLRKVKLSIANLYMEKDKPFKYELMPKVKRMRKLKKELDEIKRKISDFETKNKIGGNNHDRG